MKRTFILDLIAAGLAVLLAGAAYAQKNETTAGVRIVHNEKGGAWGGHPAVSLKLVRTYGGIDVEDEHLAFSSPTDALMDSAGNLYVLDTSNQRIQKFGPDGKYLATIGRKGQGPGEFNYPHSFDIDSEGNIFVLESMRKLVHVFGPDGKELRTIHFLNDFVRSLRCAGRESLAGIVSSYSFGSDSQKRGKAKPKLIKVFDRQGAAKQEVGDQVDYGDEMSNSGGNISLLDTDRKGQIYLTFAFQNRLEKYSPEGKLLWRADRPLNYSTDMIKRGKIEYQSSKAISSTGPEFNTITSGVASDDKGRVWLLTFLRQLKKEEQISKMMVGDAGGNVSTKVTGDQELPIKDALALDVFDSNGVLLGSIPIGHFADYIRIVKDNLLLLDSDRQAKVYHYKIVEK